MSDLELELTPADPKSNPAAANAPAARSDDEAIEARGGLMGYVQKFADAMFRSTIHLVCVGLVAAGAIGVITWNLNHRLLIFDELMALEVETIDLADQLSLLENELAAFDTDAIEDDIRAEEFQQIFDGFPRVASWTRAVARRAARDGLDFSYQVEGIDRVQGSAIPGVLEVPITFEFKARGQTADTQFEKSMELVRLLLTDHWHLDVISSAATGDGEGFTGMTVKSLIWVHDEDGFLQARALAAATRAGVTRKDDRKGLGMDTDEEIIQ